VVTDGDLFEEKTKVKMIFVDGRKYEPHEPEKPKDAPKGDLSGKWKLSYTTPEGPRNPRRTLPWRKTARSPVRSRASAAQTSIISGYLSGDKFSFTINIPLDQGPTDAIFSGTFDGTSLKGSISVLGLSIDFTASNLETRFCEAGDERSNNDANDRRAGDCIFCGPCAARLECRESA